MSAGGMGAQADGGGAQGGVAAQVFAVVWQAGGAQGAVPGGVRRDGGVDDAHGRRRARQLPLHRRRLQEHLQASRRAHSHE